MAHSRAPDEKPSLFITVLHVKVLYDLVLCVFLAVVMGNVMVSFCNLIILRVSRKLGS